MDSMSEKRQPQFAIPYGKQYINEDDIQAVTQALKGELLTQGPLVAEFESEFAKYIGSKYAVAVSNGTAALHLCAMAKQVQAGVRIITTPITFSASANCILYCGGTVDFVDIDPHTGIMDFNKLKTKLASKEKGYYAGIVLVDYAGFPSDTERFQKLLDEYDMWMIEDACHAPGAEYSNSQGKIIRAGDCSYADLAIFSFHPVKHIASGEGGMITTNDPELYQRLKLLRTHGITKDQSEMGKYDGGWYYEMIELGYNYRMPDILCALGLSQLNRADQNLQRRKLIAKKYDEAFCHLPIELVGDTNKNGGHAYHLYVIRCSKRKELYDYLRALGIFTQVHYIPVHTLPYYKGLGFSTGMYPEAEVFYEQCLSLPMYPTLTQEEQDYVIKSISEFFD